MPRKKKGNINSTSKTYKGIKFKSLLEMDFYKRVNREKIPFQYEPCQFICEPSVKVERGVYYRPRGKKLISGSPTVSSIKYSPDFIHIVTRDGFTPPSWDITASLFSTGTILSVFPDDSVFIFVETKGHATAEYKKRRYAFIRMMERNNCAYHFFESKNEDMNEEVIEIVKTLIK